MPSLVTVTGSDVLAACWVMMVILIEKSYKEILLDQMVRPTRVIDEIVK